MQPFTEISTSDHTAPIVNCKDESQLDTDCLSTNYITYTHTIIYARKFPDAYLHPANRTERIILVLRVPECEMQALPYNTDYAGHDTQVPLEHRKPSIVHFDRLIYCLICVQVSSKGKTSFRVSIKSLKDQV